LVTSRRTGASFEIGEQATYQHQRAHRLTHLAVEPALPSPRREREAAIARPQNARPAARKLRPCHHDATRKRHRAPSGFEVGRDRKAREVPYEVEARLAATTCALAHCSPSRRVPALEGQLAAGWTGIDAGSVAA
jgi:hypothetical protein